MVEEEMCKFTIVVITLESIRIKVSLQLGGGGGGGVGEFVSLFLQGTKESGPAFVLFVRGQKVICKFHDFSFVPD